MTFSSLIVYMLVYVMHLICGTRETPAPGDLEILIAEFKSGQSLMYAWLGTGMSFLCDGCVSLSFSAPLFTQA